MGSYKFEKDIFGDGYTIYDENNKKVGKAERNFFTDGYTLYDNKGKKLVQQIIIFLQMDFLYMIQQVKN